MITGFGKNSLQRHIAVSAPVRRTALLTVSSHPSLPHHHIPVKIPAFLDSQIPHLRQTSQNLSQALDSTSAPLPSVPDEHCVITCAVVSAGGPQRRGYMKTKTHFSA